MRPVSQSDMLVFERCPALWHATRVRNLDDGNRFSRIGTACHAACEAVTRAVLGEDGRELYLVARDAVTAHAEAVDLPPDEMHEALDVMDSATAAGSAISFYVPDGWTATAETELALADDFSPVAECGRCGGTVPDEIAPPCGGCVAHPGYSAPIAYRGRLDRLQWNADTGELEVRDWKTSEDWLSGDDVLLDVQARFYAMLALAWFPAAQVVVFKRVMLRLGYTATAKFVRGGRWHGQIMDRARRLYQSTNAMLSAHREPGLMTGMPGGLPDVVIPGTRFPERFGGWCECCPVRGKCMTYNAVLARGGRLLPDADRGFRARTLRALKAAVKELDGQLREDVTANGQIPLGDGTALGFHAKRTRVVKPDVDPRRELRQLGMSEAQEAEWFAPSERSMPGVVAKAVEELERNAGAREAAAERLLSPATGFNFEVKEVDDGAAS